MNTELYYEWSSLTNGEKAIYCAFNAPRVNNIPQIPEVNDELINENDYTPRNEIISIFINIDGSLNESPDQNEIKKFTKEETEAIILWITE